jgi:transketolase
MPLVVEAWRDLAALGVRARVVSMPSWHRFEKQDAAYRESVLPRGVRARIAVEQGGSLGWDRYVGLDGATGHHVHGRIGTARQTSGKFGFTRDNVVKLAHEALAKSR